MKTRIVFAAAMGLALLAVLAVPGAAFAASPSAGATLQAFKTLDICDTGTQDTNGNELWRYSGEVSVWNEGNTATVGLQIIDCIETKTNGPNFTNAFCTTLTTGGVVVIPANTPATSAITFPYSFVQPALTGTIRNHAYVTITNHSAHQGTPFGPEPKATWAGAVPLCTTCGGCVLTQGYWGAHNNTVCDTDPTSPLCVIWPGGISPTDPFFSSGQTWLQVLNTPPQGNGYYILAVQYIAAELNAANGACVPAGATSVQGILDLATAFFNSSTPATCDASGSCGTQKTWAAILNDYNNGLYPGGPEHCSSE